jgi:hypothetical protein
VEAAMWSALAILAGGQIATLVYLGGRIDGVSDSLATRLDGMSARIDRVLDLLMDHDARISRVETVAHRHD